MQKLSVWVTSPTSWCILGVGLIAGLQAIEPQLSGTVLQTVQAVILILGFLLHPTNIVAGKVVPKNSY